MRLLRSIELLVNDNSKSRLIPLFMKMRSNQREREKKTRILVFIPCDADNNDSTF